MDVTPLVKADAQVIQSYAGGQFKVSGEVYEGGLIVLQNASIKWNAPEDVSALTVEHFESLFEISDEIDVVLLGCGSRIAFLDEGLKKSIKNNGLSVDVMDTGAACRTYNVLMAEGRRVAAVLFPAI